jgi:hypothetical protein
LALILTKKTDWATFWAIFSQTHLVTLLNIISTEPAASGRGGWVCAARIKVGGKTI